MKKILISMIFIVTTTFAQSSISNFNYQGFFMSSGQPFTGKTNMTFRIMDASVGGNILWTSPSTLLTVVNGVYSYILGVVDGTPVKHFSGINWAGGNKWIEVVTGGVTVSPRTQLMAVPMALLANRVVNADNAGPIGKIIALSQAAPLPNSNFWKLCNGVETIPIDSKLGIYLSSVAKPLMTPSLQDDRFLMGGNGTNNNSIDDSGNNDGHYHQGTLTGNTTSSGSHTHVGTIRALQGDADKGNGNRTINGGGNDNYTISGGGHNHNISVSGMLGNTNSGSGDILGSNRPQYFKVFYYIKIN